MANMRILVLGLVISCGLVGQQPMAIGPNKSATGLVGLVKYFDWFLGTGSGCVPGVGGFCTGATLSADTYYWTAWLPNASGLPKTSGLPIVGSVNDSANCSNMGVMQLDVYDWNNPNAAHVQEVNCVTSLSSTSLSDGAPGLWQSQATTNGASFGDVVWHNRAPFSRNGILYFPIERQIHSGASTIHDASYIESTDSGQHWCNPYTLFNVGTNPGVCNSSKWQANGDAPLCGAAAGGFQPCTATDYVDATHSSVMWQPVNSKSGVDTGVENWIIVDFANQDCTPFPSCANLPANVGVESGCDPSLYNCFMGLPGEGSVGRVPVGSSILDITAWQYYTCPTITLQFRCDPKDNANWTSTYANRTSTLELAYSVSTFNGPIPSPYTVTYIKEFKMYVLSGQQSDWWQAPTLVGPWTPVYRYWPNYPNSNFFAIAPALGYTVVGTNPPHVQLGLSSNASPGSTTAGGTPVFGVFDFVLGRQYQGETQQQNILGQGAGYTFSTGNFVGKISGTNGGIGSFPRQGLIWSFDLTDSQSLNSPADWPYWMDRGNYSAALTGCTTDYGSGSPACGIVHNASGTSIVNGTSISVTYGDTSTSAHYQVIPTNWIVNDTRANSITPSAMQGNGSYSVIGVYKFNTPLTQFHLGSVWCTGVNGGANAQSQISLDYSNTNFLSLNWGVETVAHWQFLANQTIATGSTYFVVTTVQANGTTPIAHLWVGLSGVLTDLFNGQTYSAVNGGSSSFKTPAVQSGPFTMGLGTFGAGSQPSISYYTKMVYGRVLSRTEIGQVYNVMKAQMSKRGVTIQ